jgi:hypothetical protein
MRTPDIQHAHLVPPAPARPAPLCGRLFRGSAAVHDGLLTPAQLRSDAWVRLFPDVYACASLAITHRLRTVAATRLLLPGSVAGGLSAAEVWGMPSGPGREDDVHLVLPPSCRAGGTRGLQVRRQALGPADTSRIAGVPVTSPVRTVLDLARTRPLDEAVVLVDRFIVAGLADLDEARAAAAGTTGRDCRHVRSVLALADGLAESPQETRVRLLLHRSTLPPPVAQFTVRNGRVRIARVDFAWPAQRLALEYDGLWHGDPAQFRADRARLNRLLAAGWRVVFVTAADLCRPAQLMARIATVLSA